MPTEFKISPVQLGVAFGPMKGEGKAVAGDMAERIWQCNRLQMAAAGVVCLVHSGSL